MPLPPGLLLEPSSKGTLWETVKSLSQEIGTNTPSEILITEHFNASMLAYSRWGVVGKLKGHLSIGLPLLLALPEQEVKTVLAHELAHFSKRHSFLVHWSFRVVNTWTHFGRALEQLAPAGKQTPLLLRGNVAMQQFYFPRLIALTNVYARRHEYEADRIAAEHCGRQASALALCRLHIANRQLDDLMKAWDRRSITESKPPAAPMEELAAEFAKPPDRQKTIEVLTSSLSVRTEAWSTHPCLLDRIAASGFLQDCGKTIDDVRKNPSELAQILCNLLLPEGATCKQEQSAARTFLGYDYDPVFTKIESYIRQSMADRWKARHLELKEHQARLEAAEQALEQAKQAESEGSLTESSIENVAHVKVISNGTDEKQASEELQLALSTEQVRGADEALNMLQALQKKYPKSESVMYNLGRLLITHKQSDEGVPFIEEAMATDKRARDYGLEILYSHYVSTNRHDQAKKIIKRLDDHKVEMNRVMVQLNSLNERDEFLYHDVEQDKLWQLAEMLHKNKRFSRAWLGRKVIRYRPDINSLFLIIEYKVPFFTLTPAQTAINTITQKLVAEVDKFMPCNVVILAVPNSESYVAALIMKFTKLNQLLVYKR